jgi:hypothetical protein
MLANRSARAILVSLLAIFLVVGGAAEAFASTFTLRCATMSAMDQMPGMSMDSVGHSDSKAPPCDTGGTDCAWGLLCMSSLMALLPTLPKLISPPASSWDSIVSQVSQGLSLQPALPPPIAHV